MTVSNFKVFDINKANMMTDSEYETDSQRYGGVVPGKAKSLLHNKMFYQWSMMAAAVGQFVVNQNIDASDEDLATLTQNIHDAIALVGGSGVLFWQPNRAYAVGNVIYSKSYGLYRWFYCTQSGTTSSTEPSWSTVGNTTADNTVIWKTYAGGDSKTLEGNSSSFFAPITSPNFLIGASIKGKEIAIKEQTIYLLSTGSGAGFYWRKWSNGDIEQWFEGVDTTIPDVDQIVNFPIPFINLCRHAQVSTRGGSDVLSDMWFQEKSKTLTAITVISQWTGQGNTSGGSRPLIYAIGY